MPRVLITSKLLQGLAGQHLNLLRDAGFEIAFPANGMLSTEAESIECGQGFDAILAGSEPYSDRVLAQLPALRVIARSGVGYDAVDIDAATRRGIAVAITPDANHEAVAEFAIALLLGLAKQIQPIGRQARKGGWVKPKLLAVRGSTLGLVGLGRIGRSVAVRAVSLRMKVLAYEKFPDREFATQHGIELVDLDTLLAQSDFVSLHVPMTPETAGIINRNTIARMKAGSFLINTARGGLVNEADLAGALESGHLAGAGLDVFEHEPVKADHPLLRFDNVIASLHVAGSDAKSDLDIALQASQNIVDLCAGVWPARSVVNPTVKSQWENRRVAARPQR